MNSTWYTLQSYLSSPQAGDTIEQMIMVGYQSPAARSRFQDPDRPSTGIGSPPASDDVWSTAFVDPLEEMRKEGKIVSLENWTLKIHAWPPKQPPKPRHFWQGKCVVS